MHPDRQTNARDTEYFFLGDGQLSVAVQWSRNPGLSPYGLLIWNPALPARKESTFLFHPELGLSRTMLTVIVDGKRYRPSHESVKVSWESTSPRWPIVRVEWEAGEVRVVERLFVAPWEETVEGHAGEPSWRIGLTALVRQVDVELVGDAHRYEYEADVAVEIALYGNPCYFSRIGHPDCRFGITGLLHVLVGSLPEGTPFERFLTVPVQRNHDTGYARFLYLPHPGLPLPANYAEQHLEEIRVVTPSVVAAVCGTAGDAEPEAGFGQRLRRHLAISRIGISAVVSSRGSFDASVWQYGFEWGQDAAAVATAAAYAGDFDLSRLVLENVLGRLVDEHGSVAESSRFRHGELSELNANGAVLLALHDYMLLANDRTLVEHWWRTICDLVDYILQDEYLHESGLLKTRRDIWERLPWMGVEPGFDVAVNAYCAAGLIAASEIALALGHETRAEGWREAGERMRNALVSDSSHSLVDDGRIIARRLLDGTVQREMVAVAEYDDPKYAPYVPASVDPTPRRCDPDSAAALPIVLNVVDPASDVARQTLDNLHDELWNPTGIGGYARSPLESDPDSPGPWPFVTAFIAQAELKAGMIEQAREGTEWLMTMAGEGGSWFEYYGERESPPYPPVGIIVWGWAEFILLAIRGWMGIEVGSSRLRIAPKIAGYTHSLSVGDFTVTIEVTALERASVNGVRAEMVDGGVTLRLPIEQDHVVHFH